MTHKELLNIVTSEEVESHIVTCIQKQKTVSVSSNYITICSNLFLSKRKIFEKSFEFFYNYIYL